MIYTERWCRGLRRTAAEAVKVSGTLQSWDPAKTGEGYDLLLVKSGLDVLVRWIPANPEEEKKILGSKGKVLTFQGDPVATTDAYTVIQNATFVSESPIKSEPLVAV